VDSRYLYSNKIIMKNILLFCLGVFVLFGCGKDDETGGGDGACNGALTTTIAGETTNYNSPTTAFLVANEFVGGSELGVLWMANGITINIQIVVDLMGEDCVEPRRYELTNLPSGVPIFSIQYTDVANNRIATVSNIFFEPGDSGFIEILTCDGDDDMIAVSFGLTSTTLAGDAFIFTGSAEDICFERTK